MLKCRNRQSERSNGMPSRKGTPDAESLIARFKEELVSRGYSSRTADVYATAVVSFLKTVPHPASATSEDADAYVAGIVESAAGGGTSQSSVGIAVSAIKLYFKHIVEKPLELSVEIKRGKRSLPVILTREEIQKISTVTRNVSHRLIFQLMYSSGLKLDELLALKVKDVDIDSQTLTIHGSNSGGRKKKEPRETMMSEKVAPMLHAFISDREDGDYVFPGIDGGHMTPRAVQKAFKHALRKAGIEKKASCNSLRHSFAVHLLEKGIDIKHVQRLLGHARTETTSIYKRLVETESVDIRSPLD
jgi:integrase/recombinase XerD